MPASRQPAGLWLGFVAALAAALAVNVVAPPLTAAALKDSVRRALGVPQADVAVHTWPPMAVWWGHVDEMEVHAAQVPAGELRLTDFRATFRGLRIDPGALYGSRTLLVRAVGSGAAEGTVSEAALTAALERRSGVRVDTLTLRRGRVFVRATISVLGAHVAVQGGGRLVLGGDDSLDLILDGVRAGGTGSRAALGGLDGARVPSVLRVAALPLGFHLTAVRVDDGELVLDAATGPS